MKQSVYQREGVRGVLVAWLALPVLILIIIAAAILGLLLVPIFPFVPYEKEGKDDEEDKPVERIINQFCDMDKRIRGSDNKIH